MVRDSLFSFISAKETPPKVVVGALQSLTQLLNEFGSAVFSVKEALKVVVTQAESINPAVRTETMNYYKEAYRWDKDVVSVSMKSLRQAQQDELNKQFPENLEAPSAKRKIKGKQPIEEKEVKMEVDNAVKQKEEKKGNQVVVKDKKVLSAFGENWCSEVLESKKWTQKKEKLEALILALNVDKIVDENFTELSKTLKQLSSDKNVVVVNLAVKAIGLLAKCLRGQFSQFSRHIFPSILQKIKDKKTLLEAQKCMENLVASLKMDDMIEEITKGLTDKSPIVKAGICTWLESHVLPQINDSLAKTMATDCIPILIKLTDDAAPEVRDGSLQCIGAFQALVER